MIERYLLPSQTDKLYQSFSEFGLNSKEFVIEHSKSCFKVTHAKTGFYFEINDISDISEYPDYKPFRIEYVPKETNTKIETKLRFFSDVRNQFHIWSKYVAREINQPDYWTILQEETKFLPFLSEADAQSNTKFSSKEFEIIKYQLGETKKYIFSNFELSQSHQRFVETKLNYLEACAKKSGLGRLDWFNIAIGVLMSIIVGISFNPEQAHTLINFVIKIFSPLFGEAVPIP